MRQYSLLILTVILLGCDMQATREEADIFFQDGNYEAAVAAYNRVIKIDTDDNYAIFNRARANENLENYLEAYDDYNKLVLLKWNSVNQ